jgi:quercetin dioxygenase-like cupin family protein
MRKRRRVGRDVTVGRRRTTLQPGENTGWHTHPGPLFATVVRGTLTHYDGAGRVSTYRAGDRFVEERGADAVHLGANHGSEPLVLDVIYVVPAGQPLRVDAPPPAVASTLRA